MNSDLRILLVEDDRDFRTQTARSLLPFNEISEAESLGQARALLAKQSFDVVLLDKSLPDGEAISLVSEIRESHLNCVIIILTGDSDQSVVHRYLAAGVDDYVQKTESAVLDLKIRIPQALATLAERRKSTALAEVVRESFRHEIIGRSDATRRLRERILSLKGSRSPVLITGESGTGKELVARMLNAIEQPSRQMVTVNCGAIPENLVESELFGHRKGSFSGAVQDQIGKFEKAHQGDIFLDEIGDLPLSAQVKLLRVIQEGEFSRVGEASTRRVSVRVIAATNRDLVQLVQEGKFRADLYYRINVIPIQTLPLRERKEDIPDIAKFLVTLQGNGTYRIDDSSLELLSRQDWLGNVRELRNSIERAMIEAKIRGSKTIEPRDFSFLGTEKSLVELEPTTLPKSILDVSIAKLEEHLRASEKEFFEKALPFFGGSADALAKHMGWARSTLFRRLSNAGLTRRKFGAGADEMGEKESPYGHA